MALAFFPFGYWYGYMTPMSYAEFQLRERILTLAHYLKEQYNAYLATPTLPDNETFELFDFIYNYFLPPALRNYEKIVGFGQGSVVVYIPEANAAIQAAYTDRGILVRAAYNIIVPYSIVEGSPLANINWFGLLEALKKSRPRLVKRPSRPQQHQQQRRVPQQSLGLKLLNLLLGRQKQKQQKTTTGTQQKRSGSRSGESKQSQKSQSGGGSSSSSEEVIELKINRNKEWSLIP